MWPKICPKLDNVESTLEKNVYSTALASSKNEDKFVNNVVLLYQLLRDGC